MLRHEVKMHPRKPYQGSETVRPTSSRSSFDGCCLSFVAAVAAASNSAEGMVGAVQEQGCGFAKD